MNTLVDTLLEEEFHFEHLNFLNNNMFIEDGKVKELVYSGNTVIFLLPNMRENSFFSDHLHND